MINLAAAPYGIAGQDPVWDTAMFQQAVNANPGKALALDGELLLTSTIAYGPNPIGLFGVSGPDRCRIYHGAQTAPLFTVTGTQNELDVTGGRALTAAAAKGDRTVSMNTTGLARNDMLQLLDKSQVFYSGHDQDVACGAAGQIVRVLKVLTPTSVLVAGQLLYSFTTATRVTRRNLVAGCHVQGVSVHHPNPPPAGGTPWMTAPGARPFNLQGVLAPVFRDVRFYGLERQMIRMSIAVGALFDGVQSFDGRDDLDGAPYTICLGSFCQGVQVVNGLSRGGRHYVTSAGKADEQMPMFVHVANCDASEHTNEPFDTHSGAQWWTFEDCHVSASTDGFCARGFDVRIVNPTTVGVLRSVIFEGATRGSVEGGVLEGGSQSVLITGSSVQPRVRGTRFRGPAVNGLFVEAGTVDPVVSDLCGEGSPSGGMYRFEEWDDSWQVDTGSLVSGSLVRPGA